MTIISRAPARIGLGGGGTDIAEYFERFGGAVLNATINQYVYCRLSRGHSETTCVSIDKKLSETNGCELKKLVLHWDAIKYFEDVFGKFAENICVATYTDIPEGSGLGTSSALVVSIVQSLAHHFDIKLSKAELVAAAFAIERERCNLTGGYQDYIAAVYGGLNFTEFHSKNEYYVNPLKIPDRGMETLESQAVLIFTGLSRSSSEIIEEQMKVVSDEERLRSMHEVKENAYKLKKAIISSRFSEFRRIFQRSWEAKKATSSKISNKLIEDIEVSLFNNGAEALKISGAGGGGFIIAFASEERIFDLKSYVQSNYEYLNFSFTNEGVLSWEI